MPGKPKTGVFVYGFFKIFEISFVALAFIYKN